MADLVHAEVKNGAKVAAALKQAKGPMRRELRKSNAVVGREVRGWVRSAAGQGSPQQRRMAGGIGSVGTAYSASLTVKRTSRAPGAVGAFWGSKQFKQFPRWVGNQWSPMKPGGPLVVNPTLTKHRKDIEMIYERGQLDAIRRALKG